jgi:signal transduction histidine kinase
LERVFEPFVRGATHLGRDSGAGLGLAIARGFTLANGGWLYAESLPGQGATFVFELPIAEAGSGAEGQRRNGGAPAAVSAREPAA